ncbi:hypothetical protein [Streptomyces sp. URMC 125]|uniref:hypothetical protein n=1 Tax=Streptomyces sp. URMC 125 TaxID=3423419 RepID=UPI003F1B9E1D
MPDKSTGAAGTATKATNKAGDLRKALADPTPLYFAAGVIDKIREVAPERLAAVKDKTADPKAVQERLAQQAKRTQSRLTSALSGLDTDLRKLREQAQHLAFQGIGLAAEYAVKAREGYGELAERGRGAVRTWRGGEENGGKAVVRTAPASSRRGEAVVVEAGGEEGRPRSARSGTRQGTAQKTAAQKTSAQKTAAQRTATRKTAAEKSTARRDAAGTAGGTGAEEPTPKTVAKKATAKKATAKKTADGSAPGSSARTAGGTDAGTSRS